MNEFLTDIIAFIIVFILITASIIALYAGVVFIFGDHEIDRGVKIGNIVKFSHSGIFVKTWEGELIKGGVNDGTGAFSNAFYFTVSDEKLADKVKNITVNQKKEVNIYYHQTMFCPFSSGNMCYFLDDLK